MEKLTERWQRDTVPSPHWQLGLATGLFVRPTVRGVRVITNSFPRYVWGSAAGDCSLRTANSEQWAGSPGVANRNSEQSRRVGLARTVRTVGDTNSVRRGELNPAQIVTFRPCNNNMSYLSGRMSCHMYTEELCSSSMPSTCSSLCAVWRVNARHRSGSAKKIMQSFAVMPEGKCPNKIVVECSHSKGGPQESVSRFTHFTSCSKYSV